MGTTWYSALSPGRVSEGWSLTFPSQSLAGHGEGQTTAPLSNAWGDGEGKLRKPDLRLDRRERREWTTAEKRQLLANK